MINGDREREREKEREREREREREVVGLVKKLVFRHFKSQFVSIARASMSSRWSTGIGRLGWQSRKEKVSRNLQDERTTKKKKQERESVVRKNKPR